jgi:rhodanese-related sulfurtransferase
MTESSHPIQSSDHSDKLSTQDSSSLIDNDAILATARLQGQQRNLSFAGSITPTDAWQLIQSGKAALVDVRTGEERKFVGYVPDSVHIAWMTGTSLNRNPRFVKEFEIKIKNKQDVVLLLCRSGKRSAAAAEALSKAGFSNIFNIEDGFEGEINAENQRGHLGGWRYLALPWVQD